MAGTWLLVLKILIKTPKSGSLDSFFCQIRQRQP